jgi:pyruvate dehydrogenase E1 component alpha subunit
MHFTDPEIGDVGADGILGTGIVMASGVGLSAKMRGTDQVTVCFFGDGQTNTGRFHEGLNLASCWKLPVVYFCENNTYGESTCIYDCTNLTRLTDRAVSYNMPAVAIDGNDVLAVYETVTEAVIRARKGEGPTFIEAKTCRWRGHFEGDTQSYKTKQEMDECLKIDPVPRFRKKLAEMGIMTEKEADKIHQEATKEMDKAVKFAEESPWPDPEEVLTDVYA